jgi:demethylmenaquinone methyltransferase/2-methoxy-6-polyprenyl-1,4-benzoquinol methylase
MTRELSPPPEANDSASGSGPVTGPGSGASAAPDRVEASGGSFTDAVQRMFDGIAPRYDAFNRWASLGMDEGWRRAAISRLAPPPGGRILDVATGTGDVAFAAARGGSVAVGCDFAREMIVLARHKARDRDEGARTGFLVSRAEHLPHPDRSFDGVVSAFAMRNVRPMLDEVLREALRVLRPGARLVILEFSEPRLAPVRWGHALYTRVVVPRIGGMLTGDATPFDYLNRSIDAWEAPEAFAERIARAGFHDVGFRRLSLGTVALHWGTRPKRESSR